MKTLSILLLALAMSACGNDYDERDYNNSQSMFTPICLDGVEYWIRGAGHKGYMAVRIDPATLQPKRCKV